MERSAAFHSLLLAAAPVALAESSWTSWNLNPIESVPGPVPGFLRVLCVLIWVPSLSADLLAPSPAKPAPSNGAFVERADPAKNRLSIALRRFISRVGGTEPTCFASVRGRRTSAVCFPC